MAKIKLNAASGGGSVSLQAPSSSSNDRVYSLPDSAHISTLAGILEFDQWYLTSNKTDNSDITANLIRNDRTGAASPIGSGMTLSSGVFTFPSTGKYLVIVAGIFSTNGADNCEIGTKVTTNNSSYTLVAIASDGNNGSGTKQSSGTSFYFLDVTDTSQVKVKFTVDSLGSGSNVQGNSSYLKSNFVFIRIGDT